jgi:uncharacterized protein YcfL
MKSFFLFLFASLMIVACDETSQKSDKEKTEGGANIEIKTDSANLKINTDGIKIESSDGHDSVNIKINADDGIKVEGKDGKVELKTDNGGKVKIEKKGKDLNIQIKEKE